MCIQRQNKWILQIKNTVLINCEGPKVGPWKRTTPGNYIPKSQCTHIHAHTPDGNTHIITSEHTHCEHKSHSQHHNSI